MIINGIDDTNTEPDSDGGVGFTLSSPGWVIVLSRDDGGSFSLDVPRSMDRGVVEGILDLLLSGLELSISDLGIRISIREVIPSHVGLGSKTQLSLALADGILRILDLKAGMSAYDIACLVRRGGTSGIGINSYFSGGFILDGGHEFGVGREKEEFSPSSASRAGPAPLLMRHAMPSEWRVVCAVPELEAGAHGDVEVDIFKRYCPVSLSDVEELCHLILMRLLPAIRLHDFTGVCYCLDRFQGLGFKRVEVELRGSYLKDLMDEWRSAGAPFVGLSSFGPLIYTFAENGSDAIILLEKIKGIIGGSGGYYFVTEFNNTGAQVTRVSGGED
ncbi:MAG: beta-ribofuranosylaminobenzene 5'-phosphate synthase family protein [Promethearchaeota archaeon]